MKPGGEWEEGRKEGERRGSWGLRERERAGERQRRNGRNGEKIRRDAEKSCRERDEKESWRDRDQSAPGNDSKSQQS